jgi:type I restriction enzyme R subunit
LDGLGVLNARQSEFVDLVIDHLTEQGSLSPERFYESPFTDIDARGIAGLFAPAQIREIVQTVERLKRTAAA